MKSLLNFLKNNWLAITVFLLIFSMIPSAYKCGNDVMVRKALAEKEELYAEARDMVKKVEVKYKKDIEKLNKEFSETVNRKDEKIIDAKKKIKSIETVSARDMKAMSLSLKDIMDQVEIRDGKIRMQGDLINLMSKELTDTRNQAEILHNQVVLKYEAILEGKDKIISDLNELFEDVKKIGSKRRIRIAPFVGWTPLSEDKFSAGIGVVY